MKKVPSKSLQWLALAGLLGTISGCASMGDGGNYSCTGMPGEEDDVGCMSVREVYDVTNDDDFRYADNGSKDAETVTAKDGSRPGRQGASGASSPRDYHTGKRQSFDHDVSESLTDDGLPQTRGVDPLDVVANYVAPRMPDKPVPVRTPAQVMRVWIAPWENTDGDLVTPGYLYTEIEPRRWVLGDSPEAHSSRAFSPLSAE